MAPTLSRLLGVESPGACSARPLDLPSGLNIGLQRVERALVYAPDAIGRQLLAGHPELELRVRLTSAAEFRLHSVVPPKTPVCFASMMSGAMPADHGIRKYEKRILGIDTVFDAVARAGKRSAIVAVRGSSCDAIFRDRAIDYFSEDYDPRVTERVLELLERDEHALILAYHQEYDDELHRTAPESEAALAAARRHVESWLLLCKAVDEHWAGHDRLVWFAPDHGAHVDPATGRGVHGDDIPDDIDVVHFVAFGMRARDAAETSRAWDRGAEAWDDFVETGKDWYRDEVNAPALLAACGDVAGLRVLDIGCGQGFFSRLLARKGARVIGVDMSERQVEHARRHEQEEPLGIEYVVLDAARLGERWPGGGFDMVTACFVLGDTPDPAATVRAVAGVLRPGGRFVLSDAHPCTDISFREWEQDGDGRRRSLKIDRYFETGPFNCRWSMKRLKYHWDTPGRRHTLEQFSRLFELAGFLVRRIREPRPALEQVVARPELEDCYRLPYLLVFDLVKGTG